MYNRLKYTIFVSVLVCFFLHCYIANCQTKKIDSLSLILKSSTDNAEKIDTHLKLSSLKIHGNSKEALIHINKAKNLSKTLHNDSIQFEVFSKYVNYYFINQDHENTFMYVDSALSYKDKISPNKVIGLHNVLAQTSKLIGDYDQALTAYSTALSICNEHHMERSKIGIFNGMSDIYISKKNYAKAEISIRQAIDLSKKLNSEVSEMYALNILGSIYLEQQKHEDALKTYRTIETYLKTNPSIILQHSVNTALGRYYKLDEQYDKAIPYFESNLKINQSIKNDIGINTNRSDIAFVLILQKKYEDAINVLNENLEHAESIQNPALIKQNLLNLAEVYETKKNYKEALINRKAYEKWNDSIVNESNLRAISELEIKYQTEKKENEILQLSQNRLKNEAAIEKQDLWIKRLGFGLFFTLILFSAGFIIFKQRSDNKKQKELITVITDTQISEQQRISQDLHDSVGGSLALAKTKLTTLKETETNHKTINELIETLTETSNEVRQISHDLMPGELVKFGLVSAVNSLLNQIKTEALSTNLYAHDADVRMDSKKEIHTFRITQELVQNVIKHAKAKTLNVYLNNHQTYLNLIVEDDGLGFDLTKNKQKGIGFKTIKNRIDYLNGSLKIDSQIGKGTSFNIKIPL